MHPDEILFLQKLLYNIYQHPTNVSALMWELYITDILSSVSALPDGFDEHGEPFFLSAFSAPPGGYDD